MKFFRPLYLQDLDVSAGGIRCLQLQVNRHLHELDRVETHTHEHHQLIIYLAGKGYQLLEEGGFSVRGGTLAYLPPHQPHAFRETARSRPLCAVLDFETERGWSDQPASAQLPQRELIQIKEELSHLMRAASSDRNSAMQRPTLASQGRILQILDICLSTLGFEKHTSVPLPSPVVRSVNRVLQDPANYHQPLHSLARRIGYQPGYLNRLLKESTGLTLGQIRSRRIVEEAEKLLVRGMPVREVADKLGFGDANYFARWFKRHRGEPPSRWRRKSGASTA